MGVLDSIVYPDLLEIFAAVEKVDKEKSKRTQINMSVKSNWQLRDSVGSYKK